MTLTFNRNWKLTDDSNLQIVKTRK